MDARRSARNAPYAKEAQEGVKGGTLAGGPPFAGGLSRPQPLRFTDARSHPTPGGDGTPPLQGLEERDEAGAFDFTVRRHELRMRRMTCAQRSFVYTTGTG